MSGMNDFLSKLLMGQQAVAAPLMSPDDKRPEPKMDDEFAPSDEDMLPALEEGETDNFVDVQPMKKGTPLASKADIAKIQSIPLPAAQQSKRVSPFAPPATVATAAPTELEAHLNKMEDDQTSRLDREIAMSDADQEAMAPVEVDPRTEKLNKMQSLLSQLQKSRSDNQLNLNLLRGANQIAQGFAMGSGAKISDGSEAVNALEKQLDQPTKDYAARISDQEDDPSSDISTFMRQQAYAILKKLSPENDYTGKLENMSANQLKKLPGLKNALGGSGGGLEWVGTDRVTSSGAPVKFNKATGVYANGITGEPITEDETIVRDIARKDDLTGKYGYVSRNGGMQVMPTNYNGAMIPSKSVDEDGKPKVKYSDIAHAAPKLADELNKRQEKFNADMKDSREVATSVTNLASKLKPGKNGEIDAGLLGGIQTQAAKMAGQKGVLTDQDLVKFAGAGGVLPKIERLIDGTLFGDMSDSDIKFFKRFSQLMGKSLESDIQNRAELHTDQTRQMLETVAPGITDENVKTLLGVDKVAPIVQDKSTSKDKNTVTIQGPSGQKATMTKENAEKYLKKPGYKLVK